MVEGSSLGKAFYSHPDKGGMAFFVVLDKACCFHTVDKALWVVDVAVDGELYLPHTADGKMLDHEENVLDLNGMKSNGSGHDWALLLETQALV